LNERFTFNKISELIFEIDHDKICQVLFVFDLLSAATRENYDVLANLTAMNSQWHLKFGDLGKKGILRKLKEQYLMILVIHQTKTTLTDEPQELFWI
jgi:hypothetical protein